MNFLYSNHKKCFKLIKATPLCRITNEVFVKVDLRTLLMRENFEDFKQIYTHNNSDIVLDLRDQGEGLIKVKHIRFSKAGAASAWAILTLGRKLNKVDTLPVEKQLEAMC